MSKIKKERFHVTGTQYYQDDFIEKLGELDDEYNDKASDIKESHFDGDRIYQYYFGGLKADLIPEPENEHDRNAVKVMVNGIQVGHIKKGSCSHVKNLMASPDFAGIDVEIKGGKYKEIHEDDDGKLHIERGEDPFFINIDILSREDEEPAAAALDPVPATSARSRPILGNGVKRLILFAIMLLIILFIVARL